MITRKILIVAALFILLGAVVFFTNFNQATTPIISDFTLTASAADAAGVAPDTVFRLIASAPLSAQLIEKYLKIIPATEFRVKQVSAQEYEIVPDKPLDTDQVYTVLIDKGDIASREYSWAYQVKAPFGVISTLPADKSTSVPTNTGIEIKFNREVVNPEKHVTITPKIPLTYSVSDNLLTIYPSNGAFEKSTIYTVTVYKGLASKNSDDVLGESKIFQFETGADQKLGQVYAQFSRRFSEFKPNAPIVFGVASNQDVLKTSIYKFDNADEFVSSYVGDPRTASWARAYTRNSKSLSKGKLVVSGDFVIDKNDQSYVQTISIPQTLPPGHYAALINTGGVEDISWFQVNSVASVAGFAAKESIVWLKDISTGNNVPGVPIFMDGKELGKTDQNGVLVFPTTEDFEKNNKFLLARIASGDLAIPIEGTYGYGLYLSETDKYWDYVSVNKNVYLPSDTIYFWGMFKPREGSDLKGEVNVFLTEGSWMWDEENRSNIPVYDSLIVNLSDFNTVTGSLNYENLRPSTYYLVFEKDGVVLGNEMISVSNYVKPAYRISLVPDKKAIFSGDSVTYKVRADFFDGTPVSGLNLKYRAYQNSKSSEGSFTLDKDGTAEFTINTTYSSGEGYQPRYMNVTVSPVNSEEAEITSEESYVAVFDSHIYSSLERTQENSSVTFKLKTNEVVVDQNRADPYSSSYDYLGQPLNGVVTSVTINELIYRQEQTGNYYDPISKQTHGIYRYWTETNPLGNQTITSGSNGYATIQYNLEKNKNYEFIFVTADSTGRKTSNRGYVYGSYAYDSSYRDYEYRVKNTKRDDRGVYQDISYRVGEEINLRIESHDGIIAKDGKSKFLFITDADGMIDYKVQDSPVFKSAFRDTDIPNVSVWPVYWSGEQFLTAGAEYLSFDEEDRRLSVKVTSDKTSYLPGEKVRFDIAVTDKSGKPMEAEVNLSGLDEAVFSMRPYSSDILDEIYRDNFSSVNIRTSNNKPRGGGAEKGGGDGDGVRSDIREIALYKTVRTDLAGKARVEFDLPQNITSWRFTSQALSKNLFAGKSSSFVKVTQPFFVEVTLNQSYLADDDVTLRMRTFGEGSIERQITYEVESSTLPFRKKVITGTNLAELSLGKLPVGEHEITVRAQSDSHRDAIMRKISVVSTYFSKSVSKFYDGAVGVDLRNNSTGYTTITFTDAGISPLYALLSRLSCQCGLRLDQVGTAHEAVRLMNKHFGTDMDLPELNIINYQTGGFKLFPYGSEELELSALAANALDSDSYSVKALSMYLSGQLENQMTDISRVAKILYAQSALREPVLNKLETVKSDPNLQTKDRIYIALALANLGAKEAARDYYRSYIKKEVEDLGSYAYVRSVKTDETVLATALLAALAVDIDEPDYKKYVTYLDNKPAETLSNFERLIYAKKALAKQNGGKVSFAFTAGERQVQKTLGNGEIFKIDLSAGELVSFNLSRVDGNLGIVTTYDEPTDPRTIKKDPNLSLSRLYKVGNEILNTFDEGDIVTVEFTPTFTPNALQGTYTVVDYAPSGLKPLEQGSMWFYSWFSGNYWSPAEVDGQKVTFLVYRGNSKEYYSYKNQKLRYQARVVTKGSYRAVPASLQSDKAKDSITITDEERITIK